MSLIYLINVFQYQLHQTHNKRKQGWIMMIILIPTIVDDVEYLLIPFNSSFRLFCYLSRRIIVLEKNNGRIKSLIDLIINCKFQVN